MNDTLERLTAALADRYTIDREIGRGGMDASAMRPKRQETNNPHV